VIVYYALLLALWVLVIIMLRQGSIGFDNVSRLFPKVDPKVAEEFAQYNPLIAALIIVVASQFKKVRRIDTAARSFCVAVAAIPWAAERLAVELAQSTNFEPQTNQLRDRVTEIISNNIGPHALNFSRDRTVAARFTRAVALYWLFIGPRNDGIHPAFASNAHSRSAYASVMKLGEATAARADERYAFLLDANSRLPVVSSSQ
jgi:hypothetical protein